jgi:hypothetical protein
VQAVCRRCAGAGHTREWTKPTQMPLACHQKSPKKYVLDRILKGLVVVVLAGVPARRRGPFRQRQTREPRRAQHSRQSPGIDGQAARSRAIASPLPVTNNANRRA